ncbi:uncharacterized protein LOC124919919 [Impatiens glandulifera]|uniref:uncharacterized protein LOC124919919 n=1 Tax=Impatiens glandulifera TaxID=253017 RepID=UPI001FB088A4|nr:uncharacterized protein LOC124919919 [Impatiens glandulifera]
MLGGQSWCCFSTDSSDQLFNELPQPFSLPSPIPTWPQGQGFGGGKICLGDIEVVQIGTLESIWNCNHSSRKGTRGATFYRPVGIPDGYFCLGHYCHPNNQPLRGFLLVAKEIITNPSSNPPALSEPSGYTLVWCIDSYESNIGTCYIWLPNPTKGYKATGFVVTDGPEMPGLDEVRCVREDLTEVCETFDVIMETYSKISKKTLKVWKTRPSQRGIWAKGVSVGTFFCMTTSDVDLGENLGIACLKNLDSGLSAMPNIEQVHSLIQHYGPRVFFHEDETYMPSSVSWFFENGALLFGNEKFNGERIPTTGSNLPVGGSNDKEYWIDLPKDETKRDYLKKGNLESAEFYVHVKPAFGGTFTDIAMWVFHPFNGPSTIKASLVNIGLNKIGEHIGDWEHFTLRLSNFTGELWSIYLSQHSGGNWVDAFDLEFFNGNRTIVYSSKSGHATFPHQGCFLQGTSKLSIGVRNDTSKSKHYVDSNTKYQIVAAEYLGNDVVKQPHWLQYMREWGPTIVYDTWSEIDKIMSHFPVFIRFSADLLFELFPTAIYGEEGPTGPKEKNNWEGDERC